MQWLSDSAWGQEKNLPVKKKDYKNSRRHGLRYIDWEISLGEESPCQSEYAQKVKDLYIWWKDIRPARNEPWDDPEMDDYEYTTPEWKKLADKAEDLEQYYYDEDTEMMLKLITIRKGLWT